MALQGAPGGTFGILPDDFLGLWDDSLAFPVAFSVSDGHFLFQIQFILIFTSLYRPLSTSVNAYQSLSVSTSFSIILHQPLSISTNLYQPLPTSINLFQALPLTVNLHQSL